MRKNIKGTQFVCEFFRMLCHCLRNIGCAVMCPFTSLSAVITTDASLCQLTASAPSHRNHGCLSAIQPPRLCASAYYMLQSSPSSQQWWLVSEMHKRAPSDISVILCLSPYLNFILYPNMTIPNIFTLVTGYKWGMLDVQTSDVSKWSSTTQKWPNINPVSAATWPSVLRVMLQQPVTGLCKATVF